MSSNRPFASGPVALTVMGLAFIVGVVGAIAAALGVATGAFSDRQAIYADVIATGSQVRAGAPVKFREVTVGKVDAIVSPGSASSTTSELALKIDHDRMSAIPSNVTARIAPSSLFGENVIELVPPASASSVTLESGAMIKADRSPEAVQLATMFDALKRIVDTLQPAKVQTVLGTLAQALDGRGPELGRMFGKLNAQLRLLATSMPLIHSDVVSVSHFLASMSSATPDLLDAVRNTVVVSHDILQRREQLAELISGGGVLATQANRLLVVNGRGMTCSINIGAGLLGILQTNLPTFGAGIANGSLALDNFIRTFGRGPWGSVSVELTGTLTKGITAPPPYTAADRVHYPGPVGPSCSGGAR